MPSRLNSYRNVMQNKPIISPKISAEKQLIIKLMKIGTLSYGGKSMNLPKWANTLKNQVNQIKLVDSIQHKDPGTLLPKDLNNHKTSMPKKSKSERFEALKKQEVRDLTNFKKLVSFFNIIISL